MEEAASLDDEIDEIVEEHLKPKTTRDRTKYRGRVRKICRDYWKKRPTRFPDTEHWDVTELADKAIFCAVTLDNLSENVESAIRQLDERDDRGWHVD